MRFSATRVFMLLPAALLLLSLSRYGMTADSVVSESELRGQIRSLLVLSPYRMSPSARQGTIRYRLAEGDGPSTWAWPETGEQHVRRVNGDVVLTVCGTCGQEAAPTGAELQRYRNPGPMLESDDPSIVKFSRAARGGSIDARMRRLVAAVQARLDGRIVYRGYLSAREALESRDGDCTESALLLAAAARANGIPARVVAGLAYGSRFVGQPHAFGPHMWVQAWDGERWVSYDAGLGTFDAGHLALAVGNGDPESLRGALDVIRRLRVVDATGILPADTGSAGK